jgi:hypothetical protein
MTEADVVFAIRTPCQSWVGTIIRMFEFKFSTRTGSPKRTEPGYHLLAGLRFTAVEEPA